MPRKKLLECSFLIPIRGDADLSDGELHDEEKWQWLDDELFQFGGATRSAELFKGWYVDPDTGKQISDLSRKYFVALPANQVNVLRSLLRKACDKFAQKCIYLSIAGIVEFIVGKKDEKK